MTITVVGLGLIGGSIAKTLKSIKPEIYIIGVDNNDKHEKEAIQIGFVDECLPLADAIKASELILVAIPVNAICNTLPKVLDQIKDEIVIDFGSTKEAICNAVSDHPKRAQFVAAHPMAGTENTGPSAALEGLYDNKINIICEKELSSEKALEQALTLFDKLNMRVIYMSPAEHDKHIAYVSHLSHISSFMLGLTVLDIEKDEKNIFNMAGSGFQSTVRLAMSNADMWAPIFSQNKKNVTTALDAYMKYLEKFKQAILTENLEELKALMLEANDIRRVLKR